MLLSDREWREFYISGQNGLFKLESTSSGIDKNKLNSTYGDIPYITRTDSSNGIDLFVNDNQNDKYKMDLNNVITIGLDTQTVFYQPHKFYTGQNIQILSNAFLNKYNAKFICTQLKIQLKKFNWGGNGATLGRLRKTKILLPADSNGKPDYAFMEAYVKEREIIKIQEYINYAKRIVAKLEYKETLPLNEKKWGEFFIGGEDGIFTISSGKRLTKAEMDIGNIPFIGATDSNNGITNWVSTTNSTLDNNVLGVNYNGSVVENFYHSYKCIFSDDVKRLHLKNVNDDKYIFLFLKTVILKQKSKYTYGYKFNANRMERQKILIPVNEKGQPDYTYMEQYAKNIEYKKLSEYLAYINSSCSL